MSNFSFLYCGKIDIYKVYHFDIFLKKFNFVLLFNYSCVPFLPIPPPHPSWTILTIFKSTVQWHWIQSQCCVTITTIYLQNFCITPTWNSVCIKQKLPISPSSKPLATNILFPMNLIILCTHISGMILIVFLSLVYFI